MCTCGFRLDGVKFVMDGSDADVPLVISVENKYGDDDNNDGTNPPPSPS